MNYLMDYIQKVSQAKPHIAQELLNLNVSIFTKEALENEKKTKKQKDKK